MVAAVGAERCPDGRADSMSMAHPAMDTIRHAILYRRNFERRNARKAGRGGVIRDRWWYRRAPYMSMKAPRSRSPAPRRVHSSVIAMISSGEKYTSTEKRSEGCFGLENREFSFVSHVARHWFIAYLCGMVTKIASLALAAALGVSTAFAADIELFNYAVPGGDSGLRLAWRADSTSQWEPLGYDFVKNDFGPWGSHKKMYDPKLFVNGADGRWTAVWKATKDGDVTALTSSADFVKWAPQRYFASALDMPRDMYAANPVCRDSASIDGKMYGGYVQKVPMALVDSLKSFVAHRKSLDKLYGEMAADDATRFAGLGTVNMTVNAVDAPAKPISDLLVGIFFEDINYGADGGLYAELVQNRDFEYNPADRGGDAKWNSTKAWSTEGDGSMTIETARSVHANNSHYAHIVAKGAFTVSNEGYDSIAVEKGKGYKLSLMAAVESPCRVKVSLIGKNGRALASKVLTLKGKGWNTYKAVLKPSASCSDASLALQFDKGSVADVDMVSLFPAATFRGRENGLRADLAQKLADIKPRFVRFPGGCVAHGDGVDNIYDSKGSVGPLEARKPLRNLWGYHQTRGLGYYEYFLFCEDIGAEPLPVLAAGVPCQNSGHAHSKSTCALDTYGQQGGIPMEDMPQYIQDVLDLIEYANGPADSTWGAVRAAAGHPEPFNLKYIGIGNEDMITEVFESRFKMIYDAVRAAHPEVTVVGTVGPFYEGTDYDRGWELARELDIPMVDEHYYVAPGWLIYNRDYYDKYPRGGTKVYLGEYASHLPGRPNNVETALSDALYLTDVERNGDVVAMTSYAPLLAKKGHTQWRPDMIYFDNTSVNPTPEYYVQKLYGNNSGDSYIPTMLTVDSDNPKVKARVGVSVVADSSTGDRIVKLVNMLPVAVNADLSGLDLKVRTVKGERLTGDPSDETAKSSPVTLTVPTMELPPYSFTVFRTK